MGKFTDKIIDKFADKYGEKYIPDYLKADYNKQWEEAFKGTDYESLYNSIISAYDTNSPTPTFWGVLTGQNSTNYYHHTQERNNALLALAEKMYNENYESPISDVQRQREAGLNPDLLGLSGQSADEMNPKASNPNIKAQSPMEVIEAVGSSLQLAFTTAFSSWQSIKAQNMAFTKDQLDIDDKSFDLGRKMYRYGVKHNFDRLSSDGLVTTKSIAFSDTFGNNRFRKNYSNTVDNLITRFSNNANWFDFADSAEARNKYIKQRAEYFKVPYNQHTTNEDMLNTFATIRSLAIKTEEMKMKFQFQQDNFNYNKFINMDGRASGLSQLHQDQYNANIFAFRNANIDGYQRSDWAENAAKRAMANYQHFYHNCMLNLLRHCGYVGFTAWTAFAKSQPIPAYFSGKFRRPNDIGSFGFYY